MGPRREVDNATESVSAAESPRAPAASVAETRSSTSNQLVRDSPRLRYRSFVMAGAVFHRYGIKPASPELPPPPWIFAIARTPCPAHTPPPSGAFVPVYIRSRTSSVPPWLPPWPCPTRIRCTRPAPRSSVCARRGPMSSSPLLLIQESRTFIAHQAGKLLNKKDLKIVNGAEVLSKFEWTRG